MTDLIRIVDIIDCQRITAGPREVREHGQTDHARHEMEKHTCW